MPSTTKGGAYLNHHSAQAVRNRLPSSEFTSMILSTMNNQIEHSLAFLSTEEKINSNIDNETKYTVIFYFYNI